MRSGLGIKVKVDPLHALLGAMDLSGSPLRATPADLLVASIAHANTSNIKLALGDGLTSKNNV